MRRRRPIRLLTGPNTGLAHGGNQIFMTECGVRHMMLCLRELVESGHRSIECRPEIYERYNREAITPWRLVEYWKMTSTFDAEQYEMR
jgi:4-hydroxyacetophenone monooxygenase